MRERKPGSRGTERGLPSRTDRQSGPGSPLRRRGAFRPSLPSTEGTPVPRDCRRRTLLSLETRGASGREPCILVRQDGGQNGRPRGRHRRSLSQTGGGPRRPLGRRDPEWSENLKLGYGRSESSTSVGGRIYKVFGTDPTSEGSVRGVNGCTYWGHGRRNSTVSVDGWDPTGESPC